MNNKLLILGLGNILLGDDGVGIHVINKLRKHNLPVFVDLADGGVAGIALVDIISSYQRVLVIDAIQGKDTLPPRITLLKPHELSYVEEDTYSAHDMDLTATLELMKALNMDIPDISIVGIPVTDIKPLIGLSEECKFLIEDAVDQVIRMIEERS